MKHLRTYLYIIGIILVMGTTAACSVSYKFNGASIDYTKTKTIQLADFPIRSSYVWGPMGPMFNNELKDKFASNTFRRHIPTGISVLPIVDTSHSIKESGALVAI